MAFNSFQLRLRAILDGEDHLTEQELQAVEEIHAVADEPELSFLEAFGNL